MLCHRLALHEELTARATDSSGPGLPAILHTSSPVVGVDILNSRIALEDGTAVEADLILGADGVSVSLQQL